MLLMLLMLKDADTDVINIKRCSLLKLTKDNILSKLDLYLFAMIHFLFLSS